MSNYNASFEEIKSVELPQETATYKPVSHEQAVSLLADKITESGLTVTSSNYQLSKEGQVMSFKLIVEDQRVLEDMIQDIDSITNRSQQLMFAGLNSYDKTTRLAYAAGSQVMVCHNGMISGKIHKLRKHTKNVFIDIRTLIDEVVVESTDIFSQNKVFAQQLTYLHLNSYFASNILGDMVYNQKILSSNEGSKVWKEFNNSTLFSKDNQWGLYNACTEVLKNTRPDIYLKKHSKVHDYFANTCAQKF
jgi:hypothetical protein